MVKQISGKSIFGRRPCILFPSLPNPIVFWNLSPLPSNKNSRSVSVSSYFCLDLEEFTISPRFLSGFRSDLRLCLLWRGRRWVRCSMGTSASITSSRLLFRGNALLPSFSKEVTIKLRSASVFFPMTCWFRFEIWWRRLGSS